MNTCNDDQKLSSPICFIWNKKNKIKIKILLIQGGVSTLEKEIQLKQEAIDLHKKEASKHCLNYNELKTTYDNLHNEVRIIAFAALNYQRLTFSLSLSRSAKKKWWNGNGRVVYGVGK